MFPYLGFHDITALPNCFKQKKHQIASAAKVPLNFVNIKQVIFEKNKPYLTIFSWDHGLPQGQQSLPAYTCHLQRSSSGFPKRKKIERDKQIFILLL